jgi:hypothetical protein
MCNWAKRRRVKAPCESQTNQSFVEINMRDYWQWATMAVVRIAAMMAG